MTAKSPTRFEIFFGIKKRPSTNFQANNDTPPFYHGEYADEDPFAANVPSPVDTSNSRNLPRRASELEQGLGIDFSSQYLHDPPTSSDRPPPIEAFRPSQVAAADSTVDDHLRVSRKAGTNVIGKAPLTLGRGSSATSVESLALAAAIAHANGMVLSPDPTSSTSMHHKSDTTPEYPSPPPSDHSSPYPSGVSSNANRFFDEAEEHEEDEDGQSAFLVVGSAGNSSLPTTPVLIDSFPTTPFGPVKPHAQPTPSSPMAALATEALPIRASSHGTRQRAGSTPAVWASSTAPYYNTADLDVWEEAERSEGNHNYPLYSLRTLPEPGPPPAAPLPPEPISPRLHSSGIYKHLHQLELDITSLTRKLTTTSTRSGSSHTGSLNPSTSDVPKMLKKSASQSRLQRESSGGTSGSSAASNSQGASSASASTTAMPTSSTQSRMETALQNARRNRVMQTFPLVPPMPMPNLDYRPSSAQRPWTASAEPTLVSPLKLKDKDRKFMKEKEAHRDEREKEGFSKRRFFSKYSSMGSHMDKEPSAEISNLDLEDASSVASMHSGGTGLPDDEWGANLSLAISSSLQTTESSINILPVSSPSSQRSPTDDFSPALSSPPSRSHMSPSEYVPQHILPPAELLRLERTGFVMDDVRGRDARLSGSSSKSPSSTSPGPSQLGRDRRDTSSSRIDLGLHPVVKTRSQRSGSLAAVSPSSTGSPNAASSPQSRHHSGSVTAKILSGSPSPLPRKMSAGSIFPPSSSQKPITRPVTSPSSPADLGNALSLPPPPRPRIKSFRSSSDLEYANETASIAESTMSGGLPPPPRTTRRPSTASNASSTHSTLAQKHRSILRKPSFLDIGDEDGRPSFEEASGAAAPGVGVGGNHFTDYLITPSRSRSATVSSGWTSSTLSTSRPASRSTSRQHTPISSRQPTPTIRDIAAPDDSFLDMGKLSLDTIRSEDEDANSHVAAPITIAEPRAPQRSWHAMLPHKQMGSAF